MTDRIQKAEKFLRSKLAESPYFARHPEAGAYRLEHSFRVARIAGEIAKAEGMDEERMLLAGLLHDVSYCREFGETDWKHHGRAAARIARPFLESLGLRHDAVEEICFGIAIHVDDEADFPGERTAAALTVQDADNIDRFDVYRLYETLESVDFRKMELAEKRIYVEKTLEKLDGMLAMELATAAATALWRQRIAFYRDFYRRLQAQIAMSAGFLPAKQNECVEIPKGNENLLGLAGKF